MFDKWLSWLCFQPEATFTNTCALIRQWEWQKDVKPARNRQKLIIFFIKNKLARKTFNKVFENII